MTQTKNRLGRSDLPSLAYRIIMAVVPTSEGDVNVGRFTVDGEPTEPSAMYLPRRSAGRLPRLRGPIALVDGIGIDKVIVSDDDRLGFAELAGGHRRQGADRDEVYAHASYVDVRRPGLGIAGIGEAE